MEKNFKRYLITTARPYANGPVHIGHLAGVYVPADTYVRYLRMKGEDVLFIEGSDNHRYFRHQQSICYHQFQVDGTLFGGQYTQLVGRILLQTIHAV